jgi:hypothetical protein
MKKLLICLFLLLFSKISYGQFKPTYDYKIGTISGFKILIHKLVEKDPIIYNKVLEEIKTQLNNINETVPDDKLVILKNVPIWFGYDPIDSSTIGAEYHPSAEWLRNNGRNPQMTGGIEVSSSTRFLKYSESFPWMLMHELAHAYEFRVLGPENFNLKRVYNKQKRRYTTYHKVNHHEYFAELTEAYFGKNDTYPFNREDLKKHDPEGFMFLRKSWGVPKK